MSDNVDKLREFSRKCIRKERHVRVLQVHEVYLNHSEYI